MAGSLAVGCLCVYFLAAQQSIFFSVYEILVNFIIHSEAKHHISYAPLLNEKFYSFSTVLNVSSSGNVRCADTVEKSVSKIRMSMACKAGRSIVQLTLTIVDSESIERSYRAPTACCSGYNSWKQPISSFCVRTNVSFRKSFLTRRNDWKVTFALDTGGIPDGGGEQQNLPGDNDGLGRTRLGRIVSAGGRQLLEKLNAARKNFPMKVFLLLLGFYTANALATILGQTGDWDVLVAGIVVAAIEGIGVLVYKKPPAIFVSSRRLQSLLVMINYWKAGLCLGLFVDAFKLGS